MLFYFSIIENLNAGKNLDDSIKEALNKKEFENVSLDNDFSETEREDFSQSVKNFAFIKAYLEHAPKCSICGGLIHKNSISFDHVMRKEDGGTGKAENAQLTHPYCNTTYKN